MIKSIDTFRYKLFRSICCSKSIYYIPFIGVLSVAELLGVGLIIIIMLAVTINVETEESGSKLVNAVIASTIFAIRNNVITLFLGISWEKALLFHKALSFAIFLGILAHGVPHIPRSIYDYSTIDDSKQIVSGVILMGLFAFQISGYYFSMLFLKFEIWLFLHIATFGAIAYFSVQHNASNVLLAVTFYMADLLVRYIIRGKYMTADVKSFDTAGVTRLTISKDVFNRYYNAGQYLFIMIPSIGLLQYHPFSIASSPDMDTVSIYIKKSGDFTSDLLATAAKLKKGSKQITIFIEGPYGNPSLDAFTNVYCTYILVCGGIGCTPILSWMNHLLHLKKTRGKRIDKIFFVWAFRSSDMELVDEMVDIGLVPSSSTEDIQLCLFQTGHKVGASSKYDGINLSIQNGRPSFSRIFDDAHEVTKAIHKSEDPDTHLITSNRICVSVCGPTQMIESVVNVTKRKSSFYNAPIDMHNEVFQL